jgi:murein DD-endopeptidase MepM/ murein hydrolase activator NlpD
MRRPLIAFLAAAVLGAAPAAKAGSGDHGRKPHGEKVHGEKLHGEKTLTKVNAKLGKGDTLLDVLTDAQAPADDAQEAIAALRHVYDPRRMQMGQSVTILFEPGAHGRGRLAGLEISPDSRRSYRVARHGGEAFSSTQQEAKLQTRDVAARGVIKSSLVAAGVAADVPYGALLAMINVFAHEVDFQRDIQSGDRFELLYEEKIGPDGKKAGPGRLLYGALELSGRRMIAFRFTPPDGRDDFFDHEGQSVRRALLATPIDGARLTSGFGMRRHPLLGYSKMHMGTDFGAPTGTPVYAAGSGLVDEIGPQGGYGNYIRLRHDSETATAYAHLSRYAKGLARGARVEQGDVIGYVGSTGRSTGPHLHYEVLQHGRQVNPRSMKTPLGEKLSGKALAQFHAEQRDIVARFTAAAGGPHLAAHTPAAPKPGRKPTEG